MPRAEHGWDGDTNTCSPGALAQAYRDQTFSQINFYRVLSRLHPVVEDPESSRIAQACALALQKNNLFTHDITPDLECSSTDAARGCETSNLCGGCRGYVGVDTLMGSPGHRVWILSGAPAAFGLGETIPQGVMSRSALKVIDVPRVANPITRAVMFPSAGYVPYQGMPKGGKWSVYWPKADFTNAVLTLYVDGVIVDDVVILDASVTRFVFVSQKTKDMREGRHKKAWVRIENILHNGGQKTLIYQVFAFRAQRSSN
jgi:hypothetical protein